MVESIREANGFADPDKNSASDDKLHEFAAEARMVKDGYEINEMRKAVDATKRNGFDRLLSALPAALDKPPRARSVSSKARSTPCPVNWATPSVTTPSWLPAPTPRFCTGCTNTGVVKTGDMLLVDAGVESIPVHGRHHPHLPDQRQVHRLPEASVPGRYSTRSRPVSKPPSRVPPTPTSTTPACV